MNFKKLIIIILFLAVYVSIVTYVVKSRHSGHFADKKVPEKRVTTSVGDITVSSPEDTIQRLISVEAGKSSSTEDVNDERLRGDQWDVIEDEFVLTFDTKEDLQHFLDRSDRDGITILDTLRNFNSVRLKVRDQDKFNTILDDYADRVEYTSNYYVNTPELITDFPYQVRSNQNVPFGNNVLPILGLKKEDSFTGNGTLIAVLDNGVNENHPALTGKVREEINLIKNESPIDDDTYSSHGTAVASIIVGDYKDVKGIAPDAEILSIKVLDSNGEGDAFTLASGILEAVDRGANLINLSLGTWGHLPDLERAIDYAHDNDVIVVVAVGNHGLNSVTYPARYDGVIAVTSNDALGQHSAFANTGSEVDVSAPGVGIPAAGQDDDIIYFSGTSAATPFVTATLAAESSKNPELSANELLNVVLDNTNDLGAPGVDPVYGAGTLNVGDIQDRNTSGIQDASIGDHYLDVNFESEDQIRLIVSTQNTGTEKLPQVFLTVNIDDRQEIIEFSDVDVRDTLSASVLLEKSKLTNGGTINVSSSVNIGNGPDYDTNNDDKVSTVLLTPLPSE